MPMTKPALNPLLNAPVDARFKGFPPDRNALPLAELGGQAWNLFQRELGSPVALLRGDILASNARWMRAFLTKSGTSLCPHGKTTMAPQLFHQQLAEGAWGITLATPQQVRVAFDHGIDRVMLANELIDPAAIRGLAAQVAAKAERQLFGFVDSLASVAALEAHWTGEPLPVLVETGIPGGRCGVRNLDDAMTVARAVQAATHLRLCGVACYEGIVITTDPEADRVNVETWLQGLVALAQACEGEGLFHTDEVLLSAGGSAYFDLVAKVLGTANLNTPHRIVLRSGCYLTHDAGHYQRLVALLEGRLDPAWQPEGHLEPALEVWATVLSRPEPGLAFLDAGKRDLPQDLGLPRPLRTHRLGEAAPRRVPESWRLLGLYDQHARMEVPAEADLQVGDLVGLALSHPCTTFDKWPLVYRVSEDYTVLEGIRTCF